MNHNKCIFCREAFSKMRSTKQRLVPEDEALEIFIETGIFIPKGLFNYTEYCCLMITFAFKIFLV